MFWIQFLGVRSLGFRLPRFQGLGVRIRGFGIGKRAAEPQFNPGRGISILG